jgi:hypothetical protein
MQKLQLLLKGDMDLQDFMGQLSSFCLPFIPLETSCPKMLRC